MSRADKAEQLFTSGYNCAQSVVGSFSDKMNIPLNTALKIASPFGGGMGRLRETCGALSGICIVLGNLEGYDLAEDTDGKAKLYATVQLLANQFKEKTGSFFCHDLINETDAADKSPIPSERNEAYYKRRSCAEIVRIAADILENYLNSQN